MDQAHAWRVCGLLPPSVTSSTVEGVTDRDTAARPRAPTRTGPRPLLADEHRPSPRNRQWLLVFWQGLFGVHGVMAYAGAEARARQVGIEPVYLRGAAGFQILLVMGALALLLRAYRRPERSSWQMLKHYFGAAVWLLLAGAAAGWLWLGTAGGTALALGLALFGYFQVISWVLCRQILKSWRIGPEDRASLSAFD